jgi:hypothetical protein
MWYKKFDELLNIKVSSTMIEYINLSVPFFKITKGNCIILS